MMADEESALWLAKGRSSTKSSLAINLIGLHVKAYGMLKRFLNVGFPKKHSAKNFYATFLH